MPVNRREPSNIVGPVRERINETRFDRLGIAAAVAWEWEVVEKVVSRFGSYGEEIVRETEKLDQVDTRE